MTRTAHRLALLLLAWPIVVPVTAWAQGAPTMPPGSVQPSSPPAATAATPPPAAQTRPAARPRMRDHTPEHMTEGLERHLAQLRSQLAITPAQTAAWDQFAQVSRDNAVELRRRFDQRVAGLASMTATDSMADYAAIAELHAAELLRLSNAFRTLYSAMGPGQQQTADTLFRSDRAPPTVGRRG